MSKFIYACGLEHRGRLDVSEFEAHIATCETCRKVIESDQDKEYICPVCGAEINIVIPRVEIALKHLNEAIVLMEKSKSACKSKTVALARAEAEKAREILEEMI